MSATEFVSLPAVSRLYSHYLQADTTLSKLYYGQPEFPALTDLATKVAAQNFPREAVVAALREQNQHWEASAATQENIELLLQPDCVAIVTGQQAGLFTGPLYTIYKALSTIKLAAQLRTQGLKVVPIFWIASEDHDYEEISGTFVLNREWQLKEIEYSLPSEEKGGPVGDILLHEDIAQKIDDLFAALPFSEFTLALRTDLVSGYHDQQTLAQAFGQVLTRLLTKYGLIICDPQHPVLKHLVTPIYNRALADSEAIAAGLVAHTTRLSAQGYSPQIAVSPEMVTLFYTLAGKRTALVREEAHLRLKNGSAVYLPAELQKAIDAHPMDFSPSVALRPVVQDHLLPTIAYVAGPSELSYLAQLRPIYELFGRPMPRIVPRASITLLARREQELLTKYGLQFTDVFEGYEQLQRRIVEHNLDQSLETWLTDTKKLLDKRFKDLPTLLGNDPAITDLLRSTQERVQAPLDSFRARLVAQMAKRMGTANKQLERLANSLYPNNKPQERVLNIYFFLARYGYSLLDKIYTEMDWDKRGHQILEI
jgi:bacillithiol synthase